MNNSKISNGDIIQFFSPSKPITDKRQYRCLTLPNEMKVTLISDPETDKSAVAMDVFIGSLSDPGELMGLAHFCEHMVFMGSKKYPEENIYSKYLSQNNGDFNAYTSFEHTNFYFEIKPEKLFEAIDIFAQFFISPLFTESAKDRELQAVNSEHEKNICDDLHRIMQLDRHLSNKNHDYNKFSTGNLKTLKEDPEKNNIDVREVLLNFHNRYYSSNIMSLCVLSTESLDTLQKCVVDLFSSVVNKNVEIPHWDNHPWTEEYVKQIVYIAPIRDCYDLIVIWPIPDYSRLYRTKPEHYVSHLIGHEADGSILALLKRKGWANELSIGPHFIGNGFASMYLKIELFEEGIHHINDIITIIYQYIAILKSQEPQEWIFNENRKLMEMQFRFKESSNLQVMVSQITHNMRIYESEHILQGPYMITEFKPDLIKEIINSLIPTQMKVYCVAKQFESRCTEEEHWYGTKYLVENISDNNIKVWENVMFNDDLFLPHENQYIPSDFTIKSVSEESVSSPELLRNNELSRWWFSQDNDYLLPKAYIFINFNNNLSIRDPCANVMNFMIADMFSDTVNDKIYDAALANLEFGISVISYGLKMYFVGYNERMPVFVNDIIGKLVSMVPNAKKFELIKEKRFRIIRNFDAEKPLYQADKLLSCLMAEVMWTQEDLLSTINDITLENFQSYFKLFFSQFHTEGLIYGNFRANEALSLINDIETIFCKAFRIRPLLKSQLTSTREILIPENSNYVFHYRNVQQPTSALITYLQGHEQNERNDVIMKLCDQILSEPLFHQLRTLEQLGYIVGSSIKMSNSMQGHRIYLQSVKTPSELDGRVNDFLVKFLNVLTDMPEEDFNKYVVALQDKILEKPKDMLKQANKYWQEISRFHYNFKRDAKEVSELIKLTKNDVIEYYSKFVYPNSKYLKKLSVYVTSEIAHGAVSCNTIDTNVTIVDDIVRFKSSLPLSPLIEVVLPPIKEVPTAKL